MVAASKSQKAGSHNSNSSSSNHSKELAVVYGSVVVYAVCYMAQAPLLPYLTKQLGADDLGYGWLQSAFSTLQFLGGLLSGPFVDRYGGRALLLTSYAVSAVCYFTTAAATNMTMLYISRLTTLLQHAVLAARTIVTARTSDMARAASLGYVGAAYGVGFAVGPALGGLLSSRSLQATAWVSGAVSAAGTVALALLLPPDEPKAPATTAGGSPSKPPPPAAAAAAGPTPGLAAFWAVVQAPGVPGLLLFKTGSAFCLAMLSSTFSLVLQQRYGLDSRQNGWVLSYLGACMVAAQALLIRPTQRYLGDRGAGLAGCGLMAAAFAGMAAAQGLGQLLACVAPLALGGTVLATVNTAQLTQAVPPGAAGTVVALDMSLGSAVRMVSPLLGVALLHRLGWRLLCGSCGGALALLTLLAWLLQLSGADRGDSKSKAE